jgi:SAM-dependent methyltransferase
LRVLDLGCGRGRFVRSLLDDGHLAVGLEGSRAFALERQGEWATVPHHLHACDLTQPFEVFEPETGHALPFDAVTAWEVLDDLAEQELPAFFDNVSRHLADDGLFLCSVRPAAPGDGGEAGSARGPAWWLGKLEEFGLEGSEQGSILSEGGSGVLLVAGPGRGHCVGEEGDTQERQQFGAGAVQGVVSR